MHGEVIERDFWSLGVESSGHFLDDVGLPLNDRHDSGEGGMMAYAFFDLSSSMVSAVMSRSSPFVEIREVIQADTGPLNFNKRAFALVSSTFIFLFELAQLVAEAPVAMRKFFQCPSKSLGGSPMK